MRKIIFMAVLLATSCPSHAQYSDFNTRNCPEGCKHEQFLDKVFVEGKAISLRNVISPAFFNYSLITNTIVYIEYDKIIYQLSNINDYSQIIYGNRTFIPFEKNSVAEVLKTFDDGIILLLERKTRENDKKVGAYDVASNTGSVQKVNYFVDNGSIYIPSRFTNVKEYIFSTTYYLRINNQIKNVNTKKRIKKLFPEKEEIINAEFKKKVSGETDVQRYIRIISACVEK